MLTVFTNVLADLKEKLISSADINVLDTTTNGDFYNPETGLNEPFNWNDLFYFLSLNGLQGSTPFITLYPNGSVGYEKWRHYGYDIGIINLTKTQF